MSDSANSYQTGGSHYLEMDIQPWDVVDTWPLEQRIGFYRGNALKYAMRLGSKDAPLQEATKLHHYAEKLKEVLTRAEPKTSGSGPGTTQLRMWLKAAEDEGFAHALHDARLARHMEDAWRGSQRPRSKKAKKPYTKELI